MKKKLELFLEKVRKNYDAQSIALIVDLIDNHTIVSDKDLASYLKKEDLSTDDERRVKYTLCSSVEYEYTDLAEENLDELDKLALKSFKRALEENVHEG